MENNMLDQADVIKKPDAVEATKPTNSISFGTLMICLGMAVVLSSAISVLTTRYLIRSGHITGVTASIVTLDANKLVALHAKYLGSTSANADDMKALNQRFLNELQQRLADYKKQGVFVVQGDAVIASSVDITDDLV